MAHSAAALPTALAGFRAESRRGVDGFVTVAQTASGQWWLCNAAGEPFWCRAVHGVRAALLPGDSAMPRDSAVRLRTWGFNAVGAGGDGTGWEDGFAFLAAADFSSAAPCLTGPGLRLPDV